MAKRILLQSGLVSQKVYTLGPKVKFRACDGYFQISTIEDVEGNEI